MSIYITSIYNSSTYITSIYKLGQPYNSSIATLGQFTIRHYGIGSTYTIRQLCTSVLITFGTLILNHNKKTVKCDT